MGNPVKQSQIISKKPDETARFYSELFGWTIDADNPMGYRRIDTGSKEGRKESTEGSGRRRRKRRILYSSLWR